MTGMQPYDRLIAETAEARAAFLSIPLIKRGLDGQVAPALYVDFLNQAYHHVRHTCPLLSLAAAKTDDAAYRAALYTYIGIEQGHEDWILEDIAAITSDPTGAALAPPGLPCSAMVGYAYYAIEWISPYALMGMVHVLEGMSMLLATRAAKAISHSFGRPAGEGFRYLTSHGAFDVEHTAFFRDVVNWIEAPRAGEAIIHCARMTYWLYGNVFRDLDTGFVEMTREAFG